MSKLFSVLNIIITSMITNELGILRRDYYSSEINTIKNKTVTVMGWISGIRDHKNIKFITLKDNDGEIQIVAKLGICSDQLLHTISKLKEHACICVIGKIQSSKKSPNGVEIIPMELKVFSNVEHIPPFSTNAKNVSNIDTRLNIRAIDLRRDVLRNLFLIRNEVIKSIRNYFNTQNFIEVSTPKIIATSTEGGSSLFPIFYYNKEAFLAQSPQLYKEQLIMSFEKVFEISPIFRAEAFRTNRHLSEAISIDFEEAFVDYIDIMNRVEKIIKNCVIYTKEFIKLKDINVQIPDMPDSIPRYTYTKIIEKIKNNGYKMKWGDDINSKLLKNIGLGGFYFVMDWPVAPKPFYVKNKVKNITISESFDLMYNDLEISSGSTRISQKIDLENKMKNKGMNISLFEHHLKIFDYGVPPHAGCGIGLERLMMVLTNTNNIRDTTFYPRDVDRLIP